MSDTGCGTTQKTGTQLLAFASLYRDISTKSSFASLGTLSGTPYFLD